MGNQSRHSPDLWLTEPFVAQATITANQVVIQGSADGSCTAPLGGDRVKVLGVALNGASANGVVDVCRAGITRCVASGVITRGDRVYVANTAGAVASFDTAQATTPPGVTFVGIALESVTDGQNVAVFLAIGAALDGRAFIRTYVVGTGGCTANCIVVGGTGGDAGKAVLPAGAAPTSGILGVALSTQLATESVDVVVMGVAIVKAGDASITTAGMPLTAFGAAGTAKLAAPGAGTNAALLGISLGAITNGSTGPVAVMPSIMQG
jgi:hypothetical protein